tara:strand:+ start:1157 stop:2221 length:1065 start_codon:yes stop_codon:yes gene_type:complete
MISLIKKTIHILIDKLDSLLLILIEIMPGRVPRRVVLMEKINSELLETNPDGLTSIDIVIKDKPETKINCFVHPQDIRSGWIANRVKSSDFTRPDKLLSICRNSLEQFNELSVLIDMGANYGEYYACSKNIAKYIAIEPNPILNKLLKRTAQDADIYEAAVVPSGTKESELILDVHPFYSGSSSLLRSNNSSVRDRGVDIKPDPNYTLRLPVDNVFVDDIFKKHVDAEQGFFLKIDIEGLDTDIAKEALIHPLARKAMIQFELNEEDLSHAFKNLLEISNIECVDAFSFLPLFHHHNDEVLSRLASGDVNLKEIFKELCMPLKEFHSHILQLSKDCEGYTFGEVIILGNELLNK